MENLEIYDLAADVLSGITNDLLETFYTDIGGTLRISWSREARASAWANSHGAIDSPPDHEIVICYELARCLYRDCENYHDFAEIMFCIEPIRPILDYYDPKPELPNHIERSDRIRNMFLGALTWVYFHELGHLIQEHGYIRSIFGGAKFQTYVEDCESDGNTKIFGREATISHVTELAADVEGIFWCIQELIRHFFHVGEEEQDQQAKKEFRATLHLFVCGVSCALYRFSGERYIPPEEFPIGSHPSPIRRLNQCLPNLYERLDINGYGEQLHGLSRKQLVHLCFGAGSSVGLFWYAHYTEKEGLPSYLLPGAGIFYDPNISSYWKPIVETWDEIEGEIKNVRRFGHKSGLLYFTDEIRISIFKE